MNERLARLLGAFGLASATAGTAYAGRYEAPAYQVVSEHDGWEVRRYAPAIEARVSTEGPFETAVSRGFRVLAGYIFDGDRPEGKISMTVPVAAWPNASDLTMRSSPLDGDLSSARTWTVSFTMPGKWTLQTLPSPADPRVELVETEPVLAAVRPFRSTVTTARSDTESTRLRADLVAAGFEASGPAVVAQFDPPWTPGFLRHNEIIVPLLDADAPEGS